MRKSIFKFKEEKDQDDFGEEMIIDPTDGIFYFPRYAENEATVLRQIGLIMKENA